MKNNNLIKSWLLGLGFDCKDGLVRITHGENFRLYGGSKDTHGLMFEKVIKFNEQLKNRGKKLDDISEQEFLDIADRIGIKVFDPDQN